MFKTLPNGVEIYFSWPSRTARVVPNKSVRHGIMMRDNWLFALVAFMGFIAAILEKPSLTVGAVMGLFCLAGFVERSRYLAKLPKMSIELTSIGEGEQNVGVLRSAMKESVQITRAEVDKAYIRERGVFDGVVATAVGAAIAAGMSYILFTQDKENALPLIFLLPLLACGLIIAYVGFRILTGTLRRRGSRHRRRKDAI